MKLVLGTLCFHQYDTVLFSGGHLVLAAHKIVQSQVYLLGFLYVTLPIAYR